MLWPSGSWRLWSGDCCETPSECLILWINEITRPKRWNCDGLYLKILILWKYLLYCTITYDTSRITISLDVFEVNAHVVISLLQQKISRRTSTSMNINPFEWYEIYDLEMLSAVICHDIIENWSETSKRYLPVTVSPLRFSSLTRGCEAFKALFDHFLCL